MFMIVNIINKLFTSMIMVHNKGSWTGSTTWQSSIKWQTDPLENLQMTGMQTCITRTNRFTKI